MLASCPLWMLEEPYLGASAVEIKRELPATGIETVTDLALTYNVPAPVYGGTPVTSFAGPQYVGAVTWAKSADGTPPGGLFEANTAYTATVTLLATAGRTFTGVGENSFTHGAAGAVVTNGANSTVVTIAFPATTAVMAATVRDLDLSSKVPSPVMGGTPVTSFVGPQYMGAVAWMETGAGTAHSGLFAAATGYTAVVTLTAMSGWNFSAPEFTHSGAESAPVSAPSGGSYIATIAFPATGGMAAAVTDLALTYNVPAPVYGGTPVTSFAGPQYTGAVAWTETGTGTPHGGGIFAANTAYTAHVTMVAASGWTFTGVGENTFSHGAPGAIVSNTADTGLVTIVFPATTDVIAEVVTDLALTYNVPAPVYGGTPVTSFSGPQYMGKVEWNPVPPGGLFAANTAYTAYVTMVAASGWTFTGVGANTFSHGAPGVTVTNVANTGEVTIVFPATTDVMAAAVTDLALTYTVPAPARGGTPVTSFSGPQYMGKVAWSPAPPGG
ncbi:MAG: hypothetical protein LBR93_07080, partial [Treponema sp.]|nr:hypothetical protein [Treponema sp.]